MRHALLSFIFLIVGSSQLAFANADCNEILHFESSQKITPQNIAAKASGEVEQKWRAPAQFLKAKRGYAILIGTMVGSAALTSYLTAHLPAGFAFLSQLVGQLSTLGVYVFGSPIWEPASSGFRKFAFGVSQSQIQQIDKNKNLESLWFRTQENYSLNSQMSRNIVNSFISSTRQNFYEAHHALNSGDLTYAADQVAEAAFRMGMLFKDISPDDKLVALAIHTAFSTYVAVPDFKALVMNRLELLAGPLVKDIYYERLLNAWFNGA